MNMIIYNHIKDSSAILVIIIAHAIVAIDLKFSFLRTVFAEST